MKRYFTTILVLLAMVFMATMCHADVTLKQGTIVPWRDGTMLNLTTVETVKTKKVDSWGKWNALWEGWSVDAGAAYDATDKIQSGAILLGRNFGTLGDYIPLDFPLKDTITITLYPVGVYCSFLDDSNLKWSGASGAGFINFSINW